MHLSLPGFMPGFARRHTSPNTVASNTTDTAPPIRPREDSDPLSTYSREDEDTSASTSTGLVNSHPATPVRRLSNQNSPSMPAQNPTSSTPSSSAAAGLLRRISSWTPGISSTSPQEEGSSHDGSVPFPCIQAPQAGEGAKAEEIPNDKINEQRTRSISNTSASGMTTSTSPPRHKPEDFYARCTGRTREQRSGSFLDAFSMILK